MASFKIHEDAMDIENVKGTFNAKRVQLKQVNIPSKRQPLRQQNSQFVKQSNVVVKKPIEKTKKQVCIKEVPDEIENVVETDNLTEKLIDFKLLDRSGKENEVSHSDAFDFFHISRDNIYFATSVYQENIYKYLLHQERTLKRPKYGYMDKQPDLSFKMRSILIDWLSSVTEEYNLHPQTFHLAIHYLDTFLSRMSVVKQKFQLVGTAAMFIASKYEEIYPPDAKEFVYLTADTYTIRQLRKMEQLILKVLQFDLAQPTTFAFIIHLGAVLNLTVKTTLLAMYFSELVLFEGDDYLQYLPSQLAFSAIALARHTLGEKDLWPVQLQSMTGYSFEQLYPLVHRQHKSFTDSPTREQKAIQEKYKTTRYGRVALLKPRTLNL